MSESETPENGDSDESAPLWGEGVLQAASGLVELRRRALRFIDVRGQLAELLLADYGSVSFGGAPSTASPIVQAERLTVEQGDGRRQGAVDVSQVTYEDRDLKDPTLLASEAPVFFRRVERLMDVGRYDRIGVRYVFTVPTDVAERSRDVLAMPIARAGWEFKGIAARIEGERNDWQVAIVLSWGVPDDSGAAAGIDIDQYRLNASKTDALQLDLRAMFEQAVAIGVDCLSDALTWRDGVP